MATNLITEKMRNPQDNSWIPLRQIVQNDDGSIDVLYLDADGSPLNIAGPLAIENGRLVTATDTVAVLNNLGISWGEDAAPESSTELANTIYIQLIEAE